MKTTTKIIITLAVPVPRPDDWRDLDVYRDGWFRCTVLDRTLNQPIKVHDAVMTADNARGLAKWLIEAAEYVEANDG